MHTCSQNMSTKPAKPITKEFRQSQVMPINDSVNDNSFVALCLGKKKRMLDINTSAKITTTKFNAMDKNCVYIQQTFQNKKQTNKKSN